ncbi:hypothetical protein [Actinoplanes sp. NPDC023714]|uniref:hypothetical protein n=1 Tax=Actinoplanes sp. NPDC023714 TaxID=3154322 RepID=UPI0033FAC410
MDQQWVDLAGELRALGMWASLSEEQAAAAERAVANGDYPFGIDDPLEGVGWFFADGEELAEGQIRTVLAKIEPALRDHGVDVRLEVINHPSVGDDQGDYVVAINGRPCVMWSQDDWVTRRARWTATVRPFAVINDLLAEAGASARLFTLYAGAEDAIGWLLDPRIVAAVADSGLIKESEIPAQATHD